MWYICYIKEIQMNYLLVNPLYNLAIIGFPSLFRRFPSVSSSVYFLSISLFCVISLFSFVCRASVVTVITGCCYPPPLSFSLNFSKCWYMYMFINVPISLYHVQMHILKKRKRKFLFTCSCNIRNAWHRPISTEFLFCHKVYIGIILLISFWIDFWFPLLRS